MKKNLIIDYLACIAVKSLGPIIRALPLVLSLFLGKSIGELLYYFDSRHRALAYANIKTAIGNQLSVKQLSEVTKKFYQHFGQNLIEVFLLPKIDKKYLDKYMMVQGKENTSAGFNKGKGVILLSMHAGNWEFSNLVCKNLGFPFNFFVRDQRYPRLDKMLNLYRQQKGCTVIQRNNPGRALIQALKNNEAVGMTVDQGGKNGLLVNFFGKQASMPTGAIRLALKYGSEILPVYYTRLNGPYQKVIIGSRFALKKTGDEEVDIRENLQELMHTYEKFILEYPYEYLWTYKIWKYAQERNILILSDKKAGHLRQSQAVAASIAGNLSDRNIKVNVDIVNIEFKDKLARLFFTCISFFTSKYNCQGILWGYKKFFKEDNYKSLSSINPDIVISGGSSLSAVNFIIAGENQAKSIVLMRPAFLSTKKFDLVITPKHDRPGRRKNIVITDGALNLIDDDYLKAQSDKFMGAFNFKAESQGFNIGLLIGGETKNFHLAIDTVKEVTKQLKSSCEKNNASILATTSRRTSVEIENLLQDELKSYPHCKVLITASLENPSFTLGGILGLSRIIVTSPESISMISEAVTSKKYVIVFKSPGLDKKHKRFLDCFVQNKYIYLIEPIELESAIEFIKENEPEVNTLKDNSIVSVALKRIL
ncbi:MAG: ELM1/GtrOC1 family putative glycosyltransferase [Candidatus Omnitrophota bacterium]